MSAVLLSEALCRYVTSLTYQQWAGHCSSRLGSQWRVIYRVEVAEIHVLVMAVTAHDYRRT
jgi:Txe/YoeB family toxin of Txe-Axe toxin-antitoxin module